MNEDCGCRICEIVDGCPLKESASTLAAQQANDLRLLGERDERIRHLENEVAWLKHEMQRREDYLDAILV